MSYDDALTILLTLKDRGPFTFRWMTYASNVGLPFKVLVADGGEDESVERALGRSDTFPEVEYEYVRYPYDETYSHYYAKLADAVSRVQTPFIVLADNDDFYFVEGLRRSVEFLYGNPGYASCRGVGGGFTVARTDANGFPSDVYGEDGVLTMPPPPPPVSDDTSSQRVSSHFSHYSPTYYDVHRTEDMLGCFRRLKDLGPDNVMLAELLTSFLTVAAGKVERGPYLYLIRQQAVAGTNSQIDRNRMGDVFDRMLVERWSDDYRGFERAVGEAIAQNDRISMEDARLQVRQGYRGYIAPVVVRDLSPHLPGRRQSALGNLKRKIVALDSANVPRRVARRLYLGYGFVGTLFRRGAGTRQMSLSRPSDYQDELRPVYDLLRAPPAEATGGLAQPTGAARP